MRFSYAHKMSTYLMVWSAYLAVVFSGELSGLVVAIGAPAIALSWFWEPPRIRYERFTTMWTVATLLFFAYSLIRALTSGDVLLVASSFILFLLVVKLMQRRSCRDYLHVYVLSFLLLVAGTVLNAELTYGVFFLGFVVSSTWALTLFHLRREMEDNFLLKHSDSASSERVQVARILNSRRIVGRRFFIGTSLVSLSIFLSAALLFLIIPRIGFGMFFNKSRAGITLAGFSDGVTLGGHGVIKTDSRIVMRVEIDAPYRGREAPYIHWRGVAFDNYDHGEWRRSRNAPRTKRRKTWGRGVSRYHLTYGLPWSPAEHRRRLEHAVRQEIYLEPLGYDVLFAASMPLTFEFDNRWRSRPHRDRNDEIRHSHAAGIKYVVYSEIEPPPPAVLRRAPDTLPPGFDVYLQWPEDQITDRVIRKAREITAGAATNYDKAVAIERWLRSNLGYTLEMKSPGKREPIDFFLFERGKGHCEYFSSAMTIMLRVVGVPARNVNGFLGGEWNEYDDYIAVRAGDAHSWVEVYFDGVGWVTFDPTPPGELDQLGRGGAGLWSKMRRIVDTLRFKWFKWVIEYDLGRQLGLFRRIGKALKRATRSVFSLSGGGAKAWLARRKRAIGLGVGAAVALLVALGLWRRRRRVPRLAAAARRRSGDPRVRPVMRAYHRARLRYDKLGHRRPAAATPREHAARLEERGVAGAAEFAELTELYYTAVWGKDLPGDAAARSEALAAAVDEALRRRARE